MAIFLFIFASLCGLVTSFLMVMFTGIGWAGALAVFFATCYAIVLFPLVLDFVLDSDQG